MKVRDAIWADYINTFGEPPEVPDAVELAERTIVIPKTPAVSPSEEAPAASEASVPDAAEASAGLTARGGRPKHSTAPNMRRARVGPPRFILEWC